MKLGLGEYRAGGEHMRSLWSRQSDLSLATGVFFLAGALFSVLTFTVFNVEEPPRNPALLVSGVSALLTAVLAFARGKRLRRLTAGVLMVVTAVVLLFLSVAAATEMRAINSGLLFFTLFIYLIWFMPAWFARTVGYSWLILYVMIVLTRYRGEIELPIGTLTVTTLVIGELIARFKGGLETATLTDPLCGVWNRRGFQLVLRRAAATAGRTGQPLSVVFIDLDGFKTINDRQGHAMGDQVLAEFARALEAATRPQDSLARFGGDEFALLMPDTDVTEALSIGQRLREEITAVEWSVGAAEMLPGEHPEAFVARADELMLAEKQSRKRARSLSAESE